MENYQSLIYLILTGLPLIIVVSFDYLLGKRLIVQKKFWLLIVCITILMLIFDTLLTMLPIVMYSNQHITGVKIGSIPVEDFIYGYAFVLLLLNSANFLKKWKQSSRLILLSSRPFSWINTAFPAAVGILIARSYFEVKDLYLIIFFLLPYNLLMYGVNDVFDFESDRHNPRKMSIEGGLLSPAHHLFFLWITGSITLIFSVIVLLNTTNVTAVMVYLLTLIVAVIYSAPPRLKSIPIIDSITSSLHFVLPAVVGLLWGGTTTFSLLGIMSYLCWGIGSHMLGALPDIMADSKAKQTTVATILGYKTTAILSALFYLLCAVLLLYSGLHSWLVIFITPYIFNAVHALRRVRDEEARGNFRFFMYYNLFYGFVITLYLMYFYLL